LQVRSSNTVKIRLRRLNLSKVVEELKFSCKKIGRNLISAIIFGSLAKGNYSGSSDADVLLVLKDAPMDEGEKYRKYNVVKASIPVQLFIYTIDEIIERIGRGDTFIIEAIVTGKPIMGKETYEKLLSLCRKVIREKSMERTSIGWKTKT